MRAPPQVRRHHRFHSWAQGLPQLGPPDGADRRGPALGGRPYLHPVAGGVRVLGRDTGRLLASCHRLGSGSHSGGRTHAGRLTDGVAAAIHSTGAGASFRSRLPVCQQRLHGPAQGPPDRHQHVAQGESLGQCDLRVVHENPEVRGGPPQRIPRSERGPRLDRRISGEGLQPETPSLRARLLAAGGVRGQPGGPKPTGGRCAAAFFMSFLRHREIYPSDGGAAAQDHAPAHRLDEFPAGYSSAGCAPAEPASASPAGNQYALKSSCRSSILQRTANSVLTVCLTPGDHRMQTPMAFGMLPLETLPQLTEAPGEGLLQLVSRLLLVLAGMGELFTHV